LDEKQLAANDPVAHHFCYWAALRSRMTALNWPSPSVRHAPN